MLWIEYDKILVVTGEYNTVWAKANGALRESMYRMTTSM
jgi:hypothetical protein